MSNADDRRRIEHVWFDQDDTLYDYHEAADGALAECLDRLHEICPATRSVVDVDTLRRVRNAITAHARSEGLDLIEARYVSFQRILQRYARADDVLADDLTGIYFQTLSAGIRPFPGVVECLNRLADAGYVLGILSNGVSYLEQLGLADLFEHQIYANDLLVFKPDRGIFDHAIAESGARPEQCVLVGDSCVCDIEGAREAGWTGVWVRHDARHWETDARPPKHVVTCLAQLPEFIEALNTNGKESGEQHR